MHNVKPNFNNLLYIYPVYAVFTALSTELISAPAVINTTTISWYPFSAAIIKGVYYKSFSALRFAS